MNTKTTTLSADTCYDCGDPLPVGTDRRPTVNLEGFGCYGNRGFAHTRVTAVAPDPSDRAAYALYLIDTQDSRVERIRREIDLSRDGATLPAYVVLPEDVARGLVIVGSYGTFTVREATDDDDDDI